MTEVTKENPVPSKSEGKEKLKALEGNIKTAFKEKRFEQVSSLANNIKAIDPENRLAMRLLEKMEKAKADAKKKENTAKIKEYDTMLAKQMKDGNLTNVHRLTEELKGIDSDLSAKWNEKAQKIEADIKRKENADKIKNFETQLKLAFKEKHFEEVRTLSDKLKELDPENKISLKFLANIEKAKLEAKRKENADKINALQNQIKLAFKEGRFDEMGKTANQLFEIDPKNSFANKYLAKAIKAKEKAEKMKMKAKAAEEQVKAKAEKEKVKVEKAKAEDEVKAKAKAAEEQVKAKAEAPVAPVTPIAPAKPTTQPEKAPVTPPVINAEKPVAPVLAKPVTSVAPPVPAKPAEPTLKLKVETPAEPKEKAQMPIEESDKGNIFTRMFGKKEELEKPSGSIIDTIVAKTAEKKAEEREKKPKKEKEEGLALVGLSRLFLQFSLAFIIISAGFFYIQNIDINNTVLGFFGVQENYASRLHSAGEILAEKEDEEQSLTREINRYKAGYDNKYETIIEGIIDKRLNWPDILVKINEIANAVYERNEISQYIIFDNFSFNAEKGQVRVSGYLSDPLGKNLTKLAELEETFRYFPKDSDNPDDPTKPYFYDVQEFSSLSKSYDRNTGKYKSNFSISFSLQKSED
jgi:hypothetical protein